jgi:hypothetical protein
VIAWEGRGVAQWRWGAGEGAGVPVGLRNRLLSLARSVGSRNGIKPGLFTKPLQTLQTPTGS